MELFEALVNSRHQVSREYNLLSTLLRCRDQRNIRSVHSWPVPGWRRWMTRRCQGGNEEVATCPGYKVASAPATDRYNIHAWVNILTILKMQRCRQPAICVSTSVFGHFKCFVTLFFGGCRLQTTKSWRMYFFAAETPLIINLAFVSINQRNFDAILLSIYLWI